jgi:hypothetical protein
MVRVLIRAGIAIVVASWVLGAGALTYRAWRQHETAQFLAIDTSRGIQEASFVRLGGIDQWVQIRGEDRNNPVLLILAGGLGNSLVPPLTSVFRPWRNHSPSPNGTNAAPAEHMDAMRTSKPR